MLRILIPLDGSSVAEESLTHAIAIARTFPAELTLLRVTTASELNIASRSGSVDFALWRHQAQIYLDDLCARCVSNDIKIHCEVAEGYPAETIINYLVDSGTDLLVLTRYGLGNAQEFTTGGTVQKVLCRVDCSVLLINPSHQSDSLPKYRHILVPIDASRESESALAVAAMIAEIHQASIQLLHVYEEPRLPSGMPATRQTRQIVGEMKRIICTAAEQRLQGLAAKKPPHASVTTRVVVSQDAAMAIADTAQEQNSDLVVFYANGIESASGSCYDPVSQSLLQHSSRTLLILRGPIREGVASNFRCVYLDAPALLQAG